MITKSKFIIALFSATVICLTLHSSASADDCHDLLIHNTKSRHNDLSTSLSSYAEVTKDNFEQRKRDAGASGDYLGWFSGSANYSDFNDKRTHEYEKYGFTYSYRDLSSYYESTFPDERVKAYIQCRNNGFFSVVAQVDEKLVNLTIGWEKGLGMPDDVAFKPSFVDGGELAGNVPKHIKHAERYTVAFKREPETPFYFNANVGGCYTAQIFVPRYIKPVDDPKKTLAEQIRDGSDFQVTFSKLKQRVGTISNDMALHGFYRPDGNAWFVWSSQHPTAPGRMFVYADYGMDRVWGKSESKRPQFVHRIISWTFGERFSDLMMTEKSTYSTIKTVKKQSER